MNRLISIALACLLNISLAVASTYNLRVEVIPNGAGSLNTDGGSYEENSSIYLRTYGNTGYVFKGWYEGEMQLSSSTSFNYTMPSRDALVQARYEFDPASPSDPNVMNTQYTVNLFCKPIGGGSFNTSSATAEEGKSVHLYAYPNTGYKFIRWEDETGETVSTEQNFYYVIPHGDSNLYGIFEFDPAVPENPNKNYWNKELGEVIVDDFTPGYLSNAISEVIRGSSSNDVTMITVAGVINSYDFGIANNYSNCTLLDLSRVIGVSEVPSYAFDYTNLESVYLPATIEKIGYRAFYECKQLSSLTIYAMTPPTLESNVFKNVPEGLVVYVPAAAIAQYQDAEGWKDFTLLPIQEDIRNITVSLPEGAKPADYAQMWLELTNTKNGQRIHYVMTDRTTYTFMNIIRNTSWNVTLRNERGDVFGQIENVEVKDEDVSVVFSKLSKPQRVALTVQTPNGQDVTDQTQITWTDAEGNYVAQDTSLTGLPIGYQANYHVALSQELAMLYDTPQAAEYVLKNGRNNIVCQLEPIKQVKVLGKVKDATTGLPLSGATVSASQTFGGKYCTTLNAKTDNNGVFTMIVANVPTSLAFASTDYVSQTLDFRNNEFDRFSEFAVPDVSLKSITGAIIGINYNYTTVEGELQNWYSDYQNVNYELFNVTKNRSVSQYSVQYPLIVLLEEIEDDDVLKLTATSRTNAFIPVETTVTIVEQKAFATFNVVELGMIQSSFTTTGNASVAGSLYNAAGKLLKTYDYTNAMLTISNLTDGSYTLVTMGSSRLFNTIYDLAQLPETGLTEGSDYVQNTIEVKSGAISQIVIDEVPTLDESKLYYTGDNTSFTVNKPSVVAGNYLTLTGRIDFKPTYATSVSNVQMIVDLPESCEFVENSVMVGNSISSYTLNGNRITIPMSRYTDRVRFCIIPVIGGEYAPSSFAQFDINGKMVTQPIGNTCFKVENLSIKVPSIVAKTTIPVSGSAVGKSTIDIYDNGILVGQTNSLGNGTWSTKIELNTPYNLSLHEICAEVTTSNGMHILSESKEVTYDMNAIQVSKVIMYHWNPEMHKMFESVFDFLNPSTQPNQWTVYYPNKKFTYTVDFTNNSPEKVSNVILYVHAANGQIVPLYPVYDEGKDIWVADIDMGNQCDNYYPVNVSVDFDAQTEPLVDRKEIDDEFAAWQEVFDNSDSERNAEIEAYWHKEDDVNCMELAILLSQDSVDFNLVSAIFDSMIDSTEVVDTLSYEEVENLYNQWITHHELWESTDAQSYLQMMLEDFYLDPDYDINNDFSYDIEQEGFNKIYSQKHLSVVDTAELLKTGYSVYKLNDESSIYYFYSDELIDVIDVKNLKQYTINIDAINDSIVNEIRRSPDIAGYAQCMSTASFAIKHLFNDIKGAKDASIRDIAGMLLTGIKDVLDNVSCYYNGYMRDFRKSIVDNYDDAVRSFKVEQLDANNLKKAIEGSMEKFAEEADDLQSRYYTLKGYIEKHPEFNESQLKAYNDQLNELFDSRQEVLSKLQKETDHLNEVKKDIKNLDLKMSKALEKKNNLISKIDKHLPLTLKKGMKFPKSIRFAGKLAGQFGIPLQVACVFLDCWDLYDDIEAWTKVMDAINAKIPCEAQPEKAESLRDEIYSSSKNHYIGGFSVIVGEIGAIGVSAFGAVPLTPTWWVELAINVICEAGKAYNSSSSENRRRKLYADIRALKCKKDSDPDPDSNPNPDGKGSGGGSSSGTPDDNVMIDPSGYVYEGVMTNRVEGVTATIFYKENVEDMYGDLHENIVKWDAAEYAQENPLFTDEYGMYAWDVPQGLWQVKFEKEGYETTYSEWLPVPPPQLDINIAMTQNRQPEVKTARAYEDAVEVEFDKYMMPELLNTENIIVMQAGKPVDGSIVLLNEEARYEGEAETFASKVRFNAAQPFSGQEITLLVNNRVKSYAGIRMQDNYQQEFTVEKEIKQILSDSLMVVEYGDIQSFIVSVLPAYASAGKTLTVNSSSPLILEVETKEVTIDNTGKAEIIVSGELPGTAALTFSIEGTDKNAVTIVNVVQNAIKTVALPIASIASGSVVEKGTEISLSCSTKGSTIYYTLDGSCPCDDTPARKVYDGSPIIITQSVTIKAMATAPDMYDSEIAEFTYIVKDGEDIEELYLDPKVQIYPLPIKDVLNVKTGGNTIKYVSLTAINGVMSIMEKCDAQQAVLDVSSLPSGVYIINVATDDNVYSSIVVK